MAYPETTTMILHHFAALIPTELNRLMLRGLAPRDSRSGPLHIFTAGSSPIVFCRLYSLSHGIVLRSIARRHLICLA
jgi:hypothetical protein